MLTDCNYALDRLEAAALIVSILHTTIGMLCEVFITFKVQTLYTKVKGQLRSQSGLAMA